MLGVVASVLAVAGVQTDTTTPKNVLEPAVHRGKDTAHKTLKIMCNAHV